MVLDPATLAMIGGGVGAAGNVAGGLLGMGGGYSSGDQIMATFNPNLDLAMQASNYDLLSQIGFGNINNIPDPLRQLQGRIEQLPIEERMKRRAINKLPAALRRVNDGRDVFDFNKGNAVENTLRRAGIDEAGLRDLVAQSEQQKAQIQQLRDAGLGGMQTDVILNRARAAQAANQLLGGAADFARTGQPGQGIGQDLFNRDERQLADLQDRLGVMANFGGINPAQLFESLTDAKLDQNLRLIEQQLGMSTALQAALAPGSQAGSQAAGQQSQASLNAAQIAAQQAIAANQLRQNAAQDQAGSLASGIGSAIGGIGSAIGNAALMKGIFSQQAAQPLSSQFSSGLAGGGLSPQGIQNISNRFAVPGLSTTPGGFP